RSDLIPRLEQPAIDVRRLHKTYPGGVEAVGGIDFRVAAGEVFGLLGPNGAGKSTTIGMLTTTISPTGGSARVAGFNVASEPLAARRVSSVVFQDPVVDRALTGRRRAEGAHNALHRLARFQDENACNSRFSLGDQRAGDYIAAQRARYRLPERSPPSPPASQRRRRQARASSASGHRSRHSTESRQPWPRPSPPSSRLGGVGLACPRRAERRHTATCSRGRHRFAGNRKARERRLSTAKLKKVMGESFSSIGSIRFAGVFSQPRASFPALGPTDL